MNITKTSGILVLAKPALKQGVVAFSSSRHPDDDKSGKAEKQSEKGPRKSNHEEFSKKLRMKTPLGKLDEYTTHPHQEKEPSKPWPNNTNPHTGEIGGPAGPEPTRYGDWERKGRVTDF